MIGRHAPNTVTGEGHGKKDSECVRQTASSDPEPSSAAIGKALSGLLYPNVSLTLGEILSRMPSANFGMPDLSVNAEALFVIHKSTKNAWRVIEQALRPLTDLSEQTQKVKLDITQMLLEPTVKQKPIIQQTVTSIDSYKTVNTINPVLIGERVA